MSNSFYREIINEHNLRPIHKHILPRAGLSHRGINPSCGLRLADIFLRMIKGKVTDNEVEELEEAGSLQDISHMPARVKCAVLAWHTLEKILEAEDP